MTRGRFLRANAIAFCALDLKLSGCTICAWSSNFKASLVLPQSTENENQSGQKGNSDDDSLSEVEDYDGDVSEFSESNSVLQYDDDMLDAEKKKKKLLLYIGNIHTIRVKKKYK